jgi:hypothetical protein
VGGQAVSVPLPATAPAGGETLLLELDGYDVAPLAQFADGRIVIPVDSLALEPGEHHLLILRADDNGDIETLAEHTLDVYQREGVRSASRAWNVLLANNYRAADNPDEAFEGQPRSQQNAALQWAAATDRGTWTASSAAELLFESDRNASFDGNRWQMPSLQLKAARRFEHGGVGLAFGDAEFADGSLIVNGFSRRGLRLEADAMEGRFGAQAFTLHPDPVTSLDARVPPFSDASEVIGAQTSLSPLKSHPRALRLFAGWIDGDSAQGGTGVFVNDDAIGDPIAVGGSAWNVGVDSFALDNALWLRGEFAQSSFDADGVGFGNGERDDDAHRLVAQLSSGGALRIPGLEQWGIGLERQRTGAAFYSVGNLLLPNDLELSQLHAAASTHGIDWRTQWLDQHTDVEGAALTPRIDSRHVLHSLGYTPQVGWPVTPTLSLTYQDTRNEQLDADATLVGYDLDNRQRSVAVALETALEKFSIGFTHERVRRDDRSSPLVVDDFVLYEPPPDSRETLSGVNLAWFPGERFSLSTQWQRSRLREDTGDTTDNDLWSVQLQAQILPERLSAQLGWSESNDRQLVFELPQEALRQRGSSGNLDLAYQMKFITFHLRSAYARFETGSQWQALLSVEFNWEGSR